MPVPALLQTIASALSVAALSATVAFAQDEVELPPLDPVPPHLERAGDHAIGEADAPLLMIEYASFACPHCAQFHSDAWPTVLNEFVETGQVRFVLRPMLTQPPTIAGIGIILAACVAEDRYFDAADLLFHEQANIFRTAQSGGDVLGVYNRIGAAFGLSPEDLMTCFNDPAMNERVNLAAAQAYADGVQGTPSFFIRGRLLTIAHDHGAASNVFYWGDAPLLINGERVTGALDGDSFRRIILHFLNSPDSNP